MKIEKNGKLWTAISEISNFIDIFWTSNSKGNYIYFLSSKAIYNSIFTQKKLCAKSKNKLFWILSVFSIEYFLCSNFLKFGKCNSLQKAFIGYIKILLRFLIILEKPNGWQIYSILQNVCPNSIVNNYYHL